MPVSCGAPGRITRCPAHAVCQRATEITVAFVGASLRPRNSRALELGTQGSSREQGRLESDGTADGCAQPDSRVPVCRREVQADNAAGYARPEGHVCKANGRDEN